MKILKQQHWHLLFLLVAGGVLYFYFQSDIQMSSGTQYGFTTQQWSLAVFITAVVHQLYVLICWRSELHYKTLTKSFGEKAFSFYKLGFFVLFSFRPTTIIFLALANAGTLNLNTGLSTFMAGFFVVPWLFLVYSVRKYFGTDRAFGIDHFHPEKYRDVELVKKGIFKYTSNGMYMFGPLVLWIVAFYFQSTAALVMAGFSHVYIWVHYYFTELPDMEDIWEGIVVVTMSTGHLQSRGLDYFYNSINSNPPSTI